MQPDISISFSLGTLGFNFELLAFILLAIFLIYLVGTIIANAYVNFQPRDMGQLFILIYMLGVLTVAYIVGSTVFILFSLLVAVVFVIMSIRRLRKLNNKIKDAKALQQKDNE